MIMNDDTWEIHRIDERLTFGIDIGSGKHKVLPLGCDIRPVTDIQCDARYLPFRDKTFVIALLRHSLEHIPEWKMTLKEALRVSHYVFVILPKKKTWHLDKTHISYFSIPGTVKVKEYKWGICYLITKDYI